MPTGCRRSSLAATIVAGTSYKRWRFRSIARRRIAGTIAAMPDSMDTILIVDVDPERADLICGLLQENSIVSRRCQDVHEIRLAIESDNRPAVIVAHCALVNYSFTELALLRHHPQVKLIFYCTDADQKSSGSVAKLPEELAEVLLRITEGKKVQTKAS